MMPVHGESSRAEVIGLDKGWLKTTGVFLLFNGNGKFIPG
jgi:hypothetical protein